MWASFSHSLPKHRLEALRQVWQAENMGTQIAPAQVSHRVDVHAGKREFRRPDSKEIIKKGERQPIEWERMLAYRISVSRLGNGNPLQYSWLGSPLDRGTCQATVPGVAKSWND